MLLWTWPEPGTSPPTLAEILYLFSLHLFFFFWGLICIFVCLALHIEFCSFVKPRNGRE